MPPPNKRSKAKTLDEVATHVGNYPPEAYDFIQLGLAYTVEKIHGGPGGGKAVEHVSGQQLCEGLREYAQREWGLLAGTVLRRWKITSTLDFGRIVFAMIDAGQMKKNKDDSLEDFRDVYDFATAFESGYRIPATIATF